ncbi:MAG: hypothetical protein ACK5IB_07765 [Qingshengfaniella sp.]
MTTIIYRSATEGGSDQLFGEAQAVFWEAAQVLRRAVAEIEAGDMDGADAFKGAVTQFKATINTALAERERLEKERAKRDGIADGAGYALDLGAVRDEVGRRLACLAAARDAGGVSGQPE